MESLIVIDRLKHIGHIEVFEVTICDLKRQGWQALFDFTKHVVIMAANVRK